MQHLHLPFLQNLLVILLLLLLLQNLLLLQTLHKNPARGLTTSRGSNPPFSDWSDPIGTEIEDRKGWELRQHSCETLYPSIPELIASRDRGGPALCTAPALLQSSLHRLSNFIVPEFEVSQSCTLPNPSCETLCPAWSDLIAPKTFPLRLR